MMKNNEQKATATTAFISELIGNVNEGEFGRTTSIKASIQESRGAKYRGHDHQGRTKINCRHSELKKAKEKNNRRGDEKTQIDEKGKKKGREKKRPQKRIKVKQKGWTWPSREKKGP